MEDWKTSFYDAVRQYLGLPEGYTVTSIDEDTPSPYFCETCGPDSVKTYFRYTTDLGESTYEVRYISMSDFMESLIN